MDKVKNEVRNEVKKIISEMFAFGKNIKFLGEELNFVEFEIDYNDYKLNYNQDLFMEYSEGVAKKRINQVTLRFLSKSIEGVVEAPVYKIIFEIKLKPISELKFQREEVVLCWSFEEKPDAIVKFIKSSNKPCEWDESTGRLTIKKAYFDKLDTDHLKLLINEDGGEKIRIK